MIYHKDSLHIKDYIKDNSVWSVITDPPYGIDAEEWDKKLPDVEIWKHCFDTLKPGGFLCSFGHSRTYHRLGVDLESAGFQIKDCLCWIYATGTPRPYNIDKALDKKNGINLNTEDYPYNPVSEEAKDWKGWANVLKMAWEPILIAQKPIEDNYINNVLKYKVGLMNIDECRIPYASEQDKKSLESFMHFENSDHGDARFFSVNENGKKQANVHPDGRWPSNVLFLDPLFADYNKFFMIPKPVASEKGEDNTHFSVKPVKLMERLIQLFTPKPSVVKEDVLILDPFAGSGTTAIACKNLRRKFIGFERDDKYFEIAKNRISNHKLIHSDMFDS